MSEQVSIEYPNGRVLSDGICYRVEDQGHGYGYTVYEEGDSSFVYCGRVYPKSDSEESIVAAVERMIRG